MDVETPFNQSEAEAPSLIRPEVNIIEIDPDDPAFNSENQILKQIQNNFNHHNARLGSDGYFGPSNGILANAGILQIMKNVPVTSADVIMDIGCSDGLTLTRLVAVLKPKAGIGVEINQIRWQIATNHLRTLMPSFPNLDFPVWFIHSNILNFETLNGVTIIYMYDKAFPDNDLWLIGQLVNKSRSVKTIVCSEKNLQSLGFNVEDDCKSLGVFRGISGGMKHVFYVYNMKPYVEPTDVAICQSSYNIDVRIQQALTIAFDKSLRMEELNEIDYAFRESQPALRETRVQRALGEVPQEEKDVFAKLKSASGTITYDGLVLTPDRKTKTYRAFIGTESQRNGNEFSALIHLQGENVLIAPSYDGNPNEIGVVLVKIIYDESKNNGVYEGITYDPLLNDFEKQPVMKLFGRSRFCGLNSFPVSYNIPDILQVLDYKIHFDILFWL
jgi:hypothetical protein